MTTAIVITGIIFVLLIASGILRRRPQAIRPPLPVRRQWIAMAFRSPRAICSNCFPTPPVRPRLRFR